MTIIKWLQAATKKLKVVGIDSARLDAELIACHVLGKDRPWLLANLNDPITNVMVLELLLQMRIERIPIAYIIGHKEFYGRDFLVSPDVLIPRPDTEALIDEAKKLGPKKILDVGTGSGCIAITLALEIPNAEVSATDISQHALDIAKKNSEYLQAKVDFYKSDLLDSVTSKYDLIVANLPYVDNTWEVSPETKHEPGLALFAQNTGLELIKKLIDNAPEYLTKDGYLILEADPRQFKQIKEYAKQNNFKTIKTVGFALTLKLT